MTALTNGELSVVYAGTIPMTDLQEYLAFCIELRRPGSNIPVIFTDQTYSTIKRAHEDAQAMAREHGYTVAPGVTLPYRRGTPIPSDMTVLYSTLNLWGGEYRIAAPAKVIRVALDPDTLPPERQTLPPLLVIECYHVQPNGEYVRSAATYSRNIDLLYNRYKAALEWLANPGN